MKKGYTIIELIIVLSIIIVFSSITVINISKFKDSMDKIEFQHMESEIRSLLSFGKAYCRKNKVPGKIVIGAERKSISFEVTDSIFAISKKIEVKDYIEIGSNFTSSKEIKSDNNNISDEGYIKSAGTIVITNKNNNMIIRITVSVGNDTIRSYLNDEEDGDIIE